MPAGQRLSGKLVEPIVDAAQDTNPPLAAPFDDSLSLLRAVVGRGVAPDPLSSLATNVIVSEILDAARRSAASGKSVALGSARVPSAEKSRSGN